MKLNKHILKRQLELDDYSTAWIVLHYVIFYLAFFVGNVIEFIQHCVRRLDRYLPWPRTTQMSGERQAYLSLIGRQQRVLLSEICAIRDNITVTTAIARRIDGSISRLVNEIRADRGADTAAN
jgi:hypothetical protein